MAYAPHSLVAFGGTLGSVPTQDIWQSGVRIAWSSGSLGPLPDPASYMTGIQAALLAWYKGAVATTFGTGGTAAITWLKVNNIGADGKYTNATTNVFTYAASQVGPITTAGQAWLLTEAISWTTAKSRGPGSTGRVFLPLNLPAQSSPVLGSTWQTNAITFGKGLLNALSTGMTSNGGQSGAVVPVIASKRDASLTPITGVRVGNVMDVQRRRKNAYDETYSVSAWP